MDVINCYKSEYEQRQARKNRETAVVSIIGIICFVILIALFIFGKAW